MSLLLGINFTYPKPSNQMGSILVGLTSFTLHLASSILQMYLNLGLPKLLPNGLIKPGSSVLVVTI